ncbi:MAG: response regulator [Clostridiales bacterium]|jgi:signal transduction histidine kinase/CheY-like chemotaxis protein|nr:response regulator [Clostridiales bacterium]
MKNEGQLKIETYLPILMWNFKKLRAAVIIFNIILLAVVVSDIRTKGFSDSIPLLVFDVCEIVFVTAVLILKNETDKIISRAKNNYALFMSVSSATPDYFILVDEKARIIKLSSKIEHFLGVENSDMIVGRPFADICPTHQLKILSCEFIHMEGKGSYMREVFDGVRNRYFEFCVNALPQELGGGLFVNATDITLLIKAQLQSEDMVKAKADFLTKMSHEIRTPVNAISGLTELIVREGAVGTMAKYMEEIKRASDRLRIVVKDVLDFSKLESGGMRITNLPYSLAALVEDVCSPVRVNLLNKPIFFTVSVNPNLPAELVGDSAKIGRILVNLLSNAAKYTEKGFIKMTISSETSTESDFAISVTVSDSGKGIKEEDCDKLFNDFVQLNYHENIGIEGTGLGLAISKRLAVAMGGDITFVSEYRRGSTFTMILPQTLNEYKPFAVVENAESKRVLIYKGRLAYVEFFYESLNALGVQCEIADGASHVFQELQSGKFDAVVVPAMFEHTVRNMIKSLEKEIIVIFVAELEESVSVTNSLEYIAIMPVHSAEIADILNNTVCNSKRNNKEIITFSAPDAKVIVVDDVGANLTVSKGFLSLYGIDAVTCRSGKEVIELAQKEQWDIIFMDNFMPGISGMEASEIIRKNDKKVAIIALTANAIPNSEELYSSNGMNGILSKPIRISELDKILRKYIPREKILEGQVTVVKVLPDAEVISASGIDTAGGLFNCGGDSLSYIAALRIYVKEGRDYELRMREQIADGQIGDFINNAHSLKSSSENIGARSMGFQFRSIEEEGRNGNIGYVNENAYYVLAQFDELLQNIENALDTIKEPDSELGHTDREIVRNKLSELVKVADNPIDFETELSALEQLPCAKAIERELSDIKLDILVSEYADAVTKIERLLEKI